MVPREFARLASERRALGLRGVGRGAGLAPPAASV